MNSFRIIGKVVWIALTKGRETCIDLEDLTAVSQYQWSLLKPKDGHTFYACAHVGKKTISLHQLLLPCRNGREVDHRDLDGLNNRRKNLRRCSRSNNMRNRKKAAGRATSKYKGVRWRRDLQKWQARIFLGVFKSERDAARAYNRAAKTLFGEFSRLNQL